MAATIAIRIAKTTWYHEKGASRGRENGARVRNGYSGGKACSGCVVDCDSTRLIRKLGKPLAFSLVASVAEELLSRKAHWLFELASNPNASIPALPCQKAMA